MYDDLTNPDFDGDNDNADNSNVTTLEDSIESHVSLNNGTQRGQGRSSNPIQINWV